MATRNRTLVWLFVALVPAFALTGSVTRLYRDHERALAAEWVGRAERASRAGEHERAVRALQSALRFAPRNRAYTFALAGALLDARRPGEARAYLRNLWESEPGSARVNISLGRIAAAEGDTAEAVRYYHAAIEGFWPEAAERNRREARLELARYLVSRGEHARAQAELIPLAADLPAGTAEAGVVGRLLLEAGATPQARALFESRLRTDRANPVLLAGAAEAAFRMGDYAAAHSYFTRAERAGATIVGRNALVAAEILRIDPFQRRLPATERARRAIAAFERAAARAAECPQGAPGARELLDAVRPQLSARALQRNPDLLEDTMERAYRVEASAREACGDTATPLDTALLLIGRQHFGP